MEIKPPAIGGLFLGGLIMDNTVERSKVIKDYDALCDKLYSSICASECVGM